jgi:hypothetical protein
VWGASSETIAVSSWANADPERVDDTPQAMKKQPSFKKGLIGYSLSLGEWRGRPVFMS